jgi:hypothetical protein
MGIIVGLLGTDPPDALAWDDVALIQAGTGRRVLSDDEVGVLGPLADLFPLLA